MLNRTPTRRLGCAGSSLSTLLTGVVVAGVELLLPCGSPFALLFASGVVLRVCLSLPFTIYGDRSLARSACALPALMRAHLQYKEVNEHPQAISWERRLAAQRLRHERARIQRHYRTDNLRTTLPYVVGWGCSLYTVCVLAPQLAAMINTTTAATADGRASMQEGGWRSIVSPLALAVVQTMSDGATDADGCNRTLSTVPTEDDTQAASATSAVTTWSVIVLPRLLARSLDGSTWICCICDPTLSLAAGLTLINLLHHLHCRSGFNDRLDAGLQRARRMACMVMGSVMLSLLVATPMGYHFGYLALANEVASDTKAGFGSDGMLGAVCLYASSIAPVWLGVACTTAIKSFLGMRTAAGRALLRIPRYPLTHGSYGNECTAEYHEYRLMATGTDVDARRRDWQDQKRILEYECDVRINAYLARLKLFREIDELEHEVDKMKRKRAVVRRRRCEQMSRSEAEAGQTYSPSPETRVSRCVTDRSSGPCVAEQVSRDAAVTAHNDVTPSAHDCVRMDEHQARRDRQRCHSCEKAE